MSLYRESLALVDEHANDFRLDPLLSLHIYHNLAELLPVVSESTQQCSHHVSVNPSEDGDEKKRKLLSSGKFDQYYVKRRKMGQGKKQSTTSIDKSSTDCSEHANCDENPPAWLNDGNLGTENDVQCQMSSRCFSDKCLKKACEDIKQKYLSVFTSKLSMARRDYTNSHSQVALPLSLSFSLHLFIPCGLYMKEPINDSGFFFGLWVISNFQFVSYLSVIFWLLEIWSDKW